MKRNLATILAVSLIALSCSCSKTSQGGGGGTDPTPPSGGGETGGVSSVTAVTSSLSVTLSTDKAVYSPGQTVTFTAQGLPSGAKVRYRSCGKTIAEATPSSSTWTWTAPGDDFTGYLAEVYTKKEDGSEVIHGTIAVDVSSDWTLFPRYGFVGDFGPEITEDAMRADNEMMLRCHINGVQFYDWQNKHHWPLGGTRENLLDTYKDIANRDVSNTTVKNFITLFHSWGMKCMFYNLAFGALDDAAADGVDEKWYIFKGTGHTDKDAHTLPSGWKSSIYLLDPGNAEWQAYMAQRNDDVYASLDFDGYHIDQLGDRGKRYDYSGNSVNLPKGYASFIEAMKKAHPAKSLVMNSVSSYGASMIAGTGKTDFLYNEVWGDQEAFSDLYTIIKANDQYAGGHKNTVLAAYMNYDKSGSKGEFNTPGILLADAVIFALGGAHLELGDHMLCNEYFPNRNLSMSEALKTNIIRYYDFMTAYENLLREDGTLAQTSVNVTCTESSKKISFNEWPPKLSTVTTFSKKVGNRTVVHLLNFLSADQLVWRDLKGTMPEPRQVSDIPVSIPASGKVSRIWMASPDRHAGASQDLAFEQKDGYVYFTVPSLKYWDMIVME